jgi:hypothetical protein
MRAALQPGSQPGSPRSWNGATLLAPAASPRSRSGAAAPHASARGALAALLMLLLAASLIVIVSLMRERQRTESDLQVAQPGAIVVSAAEQLAQERAALASERAALNSERAALRSERAALGSERPAPQSAPQSALHGAEPPCWNQTLFQAFSNVTLPEFPSNRVCRSAVSFRGSDALFRRFARKLSEGRCSHTVLLGASISCGSRLEDYTPKGHRDWVHRHSFLPTLIDLLNARYPCSEGGTTGQQEQQKQGRHSFTNLCHPATTTSDAYMSLLRSSNQDALRRADLIIVEKSPNDIEAFGGMGNALYSRHAKAGARVAESFRSKVLFWVELFVRRARSRFPDAGLLFLEASSYRTWSATPPFRRDAAAAHIEALEHYDVPQIDMLRMLGPNSYSARQRFLEEVYLSADRIHPTFAGHMLIASALAQFLSDIARAFVAQQGHLGAWLLAPPEDQRLPDRGALVLSPQNLSLVEADPVVQIDLADELAIKRVVVAADPGWALASDHKPRPKVWMTQTKASCTVLKVGSGQPSFITVDVCASTREKHFSAVNFTIFQREDCRVDGDVAADNDSGKPVALPAAKDWLRDTPVRVLVSKVINTFGYGESITKEEDGGSTQVYTYWVSVPGGSGSARQHQHCPLFMLACETEADHTVRAKTANLFKWVGLTVFAENAAPEANATREAP